MTSLTTPAGPAAAAAVPAGATAVAAVPAPSPGVPAPAPPRPQATGPAPHGFSALLRLAVVSLDGDGRVAHWNRGAEELFGHRWEAVFGHSAGGLLDTTAAGPDSAQRDGFGLLDAVTATSWAGEFAVTGLNDRHREAMWWSYRMDDEPGGGLLVLAANAAALRSGGLRVAVGRRMLPYALAGSAGPAGVRVTPRLGPPTDPHRPVDDATAERLRAVLPRAGRGRMEQLMRLVRRLGYPAIEVEGAAALPVLPYEAYEAYSAAAGPADRPDPVLAPAARRPQLPAPAESFRPQQHPAPAGPATTPAAAPRAARARRAVLRTPAGPADATAVPDAPAPALTGTVTGTVTGAGGNGSGPAPGSVPVPPGGIGAPPRSGYVAAHPHSAPRQRHRHPAPDGAEPGVPQLPAAPEGARAHPQVPTQPDPRVTAPGDLVNQQLALLRETGLRVGTTLSLDVTAAELCTVAVPRFADFATVLVLDDVFSGTWADTALAAGHRREAGRAPGTLPAGALTDGCRVPQVTVRRLATAGHSDDGAWERLLPEDELFVLDVRPATGFTETLMLPCVGTEIADALAADLGVPGVGQLLPGKSLLITPLIARGVVLGRMFLVRGPRTPPFTEQDRVTAEGLAARGAVHLDNARLHHSEARAANTLQRSMLPGTPPPMPGVKVAHHYRPGDRQAQVGGDWFDAIQLPGGRVALVVGDVMGHGLLSAAVMGQFRTAVQTMAALDLPPAQLLRHLDNLAQKLGPDHLATCVYAVYDPIRRTLTLAGAGHIPPVLAHPDGRSELLRVPEGAPIGVGGVPFEAVEIAAPDGSWLVLCTDGLVEVRGEGMDAGLAALCANVIEPDHTPEDVCGQILSRVHYEERTDDVALLVARFDGIAEQDVATWELRVDDAEVRTARALTRERLAAWGLEQLSDLTELLVSELVTNALRVASQRVTLRLMRVGKLLVEVSDDDHHLPQLRRADEDDEHGRGLALVSNLSRRWGTSRQPVGKVVWFELPLPKG